MTIDLELAAQTRQLLESLGAPLLRPFLDEWPVTGERRTVTPTSLPVLPWLGEIGGDAAAFGRELVASLCRAAPTLAWRQTYTAADVDAAFLENYGWTEICGAAGPLASERLACGFLLLGPMTLYPRHHHAAEEVYVPLSGAANWLQGDGLWRPRPLGSLIFHAGDEPHAMQTGAGPLLALYLWRGANLKEKALLG